MTKGLRAKSRRRRAFGNLDEDVFLSLTRTTDFLTQNVEGLLKASGLSATQYNVLRILRGAGPQGLTCGETSKRMLTHDPDMTRLFDRLEARGLIRRERDSRDRRVVTARIINRGLKLLTRLDRPVRNAHRRRFAHLSERDLKALLRALEAIREPGK